MKAMTRTRLAECAGVSTDTLHRYIEAHLGELTALGYRQGRRLTPRVVKWIVANYGADVDENNAK